MKTTKRPSVGNAQDDATTRLNIRVRTSVQQRLMIASVMSRRAPGDIVAELIETHLREFRVQRNSTTRDGSHDRLPTEVGVDISAASPPIEVAA